MSQEKVDKIIDGSISFRELEKGKPSWLWIKNGKGEASVSATLLIIAFFATTFAYVTSSFETIGPFTPKPFDVGACSAYFIPLLTLYFGRRWTEAKKGN